MKIEFPIAEQKQAFIACYWTFFLLLLFCFQSFLQMSFVESQQLKPRYSFAWTSHTITHTNSFLGTMKSHPYIYKAQFWTGNKPMHASNELANSTHTGPNQDLNQSLLIWGKGDSHYTIVQPQMHYGTVCKNSQKQFYLIWEKNNFLTLFSQTWQTAHLFHW